MDVKYRVVENFNNICRMLSRRLTSLSLPDVSTKSGQAVSLSNLITSSNGRCLELVFPILPAKLPHTQPCF